MTRKRHLNGSRAWVTRARHVVRLTNPDLLTLSVGVRLQLYRACVRDGVAYSLFSSSPFPQDCYGSRKLRAVVADLFRHRITVSPSNQ